MPVLSICRPGWPALSLLAALALPHRLPAQPQPPRYTVTDLGPTDSPFSFSQATAIINNGFVTGLAVNADGTQHCRPGTTDGRSISPVLDSWGRIVEHSASTLVPKPRYYPKSTARTSTMKTSAATEPASCVALSSGRAARIPRFPCWEGNNGAVNAINNQGAVAGEVENNVRDQRP